MKISLRALFVLAIIVNSSISFTQIIHETGSPLSWNYLKGDLLEIPSIRMSSFDVDLMIEEDLVNDVEKIGPWRFGKAFETNYTIQNTGVWQELNNGERLWQLKLTSKNAMSMNIIFDEFVLVPGDQLFIYNEDHTEVLGPLTHLNNKEWMGLATLPIQGEDLIVELHQKQPNLVEKSKLTIGQVTHGYRDIFGYAKRLYNKDINDSGACNNNVICPEGDPWRCEISSVAIIIVGGSGACTGTVLNNHAEDERALFLSADHCGTNVTNWVFRFNWDSPTCTPTQNGPTSQSVSGATLLANSGGSDFCLMELSSAIPPSYNVYYSGWDASGAMPTNQTAIHHPSGDLKKISFDNEAAVHGVMGGAPCWRILNWDDGTTEPGSSGSGLWDQDHHLIGQLFGGTATCNNNIDDYYGRLDISWDGDGAANNRVKDYLDPNNTGIKVLDGRGTGICAGVIYDNDGSIYGINGLDNSYCNVLNATPTATLKNVGNLTLSSATISYDFNSGSQSGTIPWTGNLATGQTAIINLPTLNFSGGTNNLVVTSTLPNGVADQNAANNTKTSNLYAVLNGIQVTVDIIQDEYGSETTWEINDGTSTLYTGGPYSDDNDQVLETSDVCLNIGECYNFVIYDGYEDGMCCDFGNGSYSVNYNGTVFAAGGSFGAEETTNFCVPLALDEMELLNVKIYPNPTNGEFTINFVDQKNVEAKVNVLNASGKVVNSTVIYTNSTKFDLKGHSNGLYFVEVITESARSVYKISLNK